MVMTNDKRWWKVADVDQNGNVINVTQVISLPHIAAYNKLIVETALRSDPQPQEGDEVRSPATKDMKGTFGKARELPGGDILFWVRQTSSRGQRMMLYLIRTHNAPDEVRALVIPEEVFNVEAPEGYDAHNFGIDPTNRNLTGDGMALFDANEACCACFTTHEDAQYMCEATCGKHRGCTECFDKVKNGNGQKFCPICREEGEPVRIFNPHNEKKRGGRRL